MRKITVQFMNGNKPRTGLLEYMQQQIATLRLAGRLSTARNYMRTINSMKTFLMTGSHDNDKDARCQR